eukprot:5999882-Alexandrium_andersonii.AAC.1
MENPDGGSLGTRNTRRGFHTSTSRESATTAFVASLSTLIVLVILAIIINRLLPRGRLAPRARLAVLDPQARVTQRVQ